MFKAIANFFYLLWQGIRNLWCNRMMSFASIGVLISCMLLSGGSVLISMNVQSVMSDIEQNNLVMVYLDDDVSALEAVQLGNEINALANVSESTLITREEALEDMMANVDGADVLLEQLQGDNPLPNAYRVTLEDLEKFDHTVEQLRLIDGVQSVRGESSSSEQLIQIEKTITGTLLWIILLLVVVSMFIITNTVRVTMFNRRREISIMKSVGATDWFIRIPFIVEGAVIGVVSGGLTTLLIEYIYNNIRWGDGALLWSPLPFEPLRWLFGAAFVGAGIVFGSIGGVISIGRYLKDEGGDLFE